MTKPKTLKPKLISEFNKNASEVVRVQLTEYQGKQLLDIRVWVLQEGADAIPTKKGLCLKVEQVGDLKEAIDKAAKEIKKGE